MGLSGESTGPGSHALLQGTLDWLPKDPRAHSCPGAQSCPHTSAQRTTGDLAPQDCAPSTSPRPCEPPGSCSGLRAGLARQRAQQGTATVGALSAPRTDRRRPNTSLRTQPLEQTSISRLSKWPSSKSPQETHAGQKVEKRDSSGTAGRNGNWQSGREQHGGSQEPEAEPQDTATPTQTVTRRKGNRRLRDTRRSAFIESFTTAEMEAT